MQFKKNKVWLATDPKGNPITKNGKMLIKYQLEQDYEYWVHQKNIKPIDESSPESHTLKKSETATASLQPDHTTSEIATRATPAAATGKTIDIQYFRSAIGAPEKHKLIIKGLGFKRLNQVVNRVDTPAVRGMVAQVPHLVRVLQEKE